VVENFIRNIKKRSSKSAWSVKTLNTILTNEVYAGHWHYGRTRSKYPGRKLEDGKRNSRLLVDRAEWTTVEVPSIVDEQTFAEAQVRVNANRKKWANNVKQTYMMRGRIVCAECGKNYIGRTLTSGGKKYSYYVHNPNRKIAKTRSASSGTSMTIRLGSV